MIEFGAELVQWPECTRDGNIYRKAEHDHQGALAEDRFLKDLVRGFLSDLHRFGDLNDDRTGRVTGKDRLQENRNADRLIVIGVFVEMDNRWIGGVLG